MDYIDGFVIAAPTADKDKVIEHARHVDAMFLEFGATRAVECWGDDVPDGKVTDFRRAVQAAEGETILFSWIERPNKETRDTAMARIPSDPRFGQVPVPFDGKRMIFGGFRPIVDMKP